MKKSTLLLASILFLTLSITQACQSSAKKVENAEDNVLDAKKDLNESQNDLVIARNDSINDYMLFKKEAEMKIIAQEKNIADFKARIAKEKKEVKADYQKKLTDLENKNTDLKKNLADLKDDGQNKWISFKKEFNHDMDELGQALKDLTVENVN